MSRNSGQSSKKSILVINTSEGEPSRHRSAVPGKSPIKTPDQYQKKRTKSIANERWSILKEAILSKSRSFHNSKASVRRFDSFGFIKCIKVAYSDSPASRNPSNSKPRSQKYYTKNNEWDEDDDDDICVSNEQTDKSESEDYEWFSISVPTIESMDSVKVRFYKGPIGLKDMMGFNNTGNVCLWPSEEIMTYFCIKNSAIFDDKSVCELGGGMTSLAGLMVDE
jgi:hypothetical protein